MTNLTTRDHREQDEGLRPHPGSQVVAILRINWSPLAENTKDSSASPGFARYDIISQ